MKKDSTFLCLILYNNYYRIMIMIQLHFKRKGFVIILCNAQERFTHPRVYSSFSLTFQWFLLTRFLYYSTIGNAVTRCFTTSRSYPVGTVNQRLSVLCMTRYHWGFSHCRYFVVLGMSPPCRIGNLLGFQSVCVWFRDTYNS